jgi:CRISPR/Cas system-associated exonuclease Cas4 (RecB family)
MSEYYRPKRTKSIFDPNHPDPFNLSRSKIDLFLECPRCFYVDRRLGVGRPPGFPFNLNSAVDHLLKQEFDAHRAQGSQHPLLEKYGVDARPVAHDSLDVWRENFKGVELWHEPTNFTVTGAIDDLWVNAKGEYIVVDYKATSKDEPVQALNDTWHIGYKRQMEVYQWLLRGNGLTVSDTGYFVYCNGRRDREAFDAKLEFDVVLIPYQGKATWIEDVLVSARACLEADTPPSPGGACDYCAYVAAREEVERELERW